MKKRTKTKPYDQLVDHVMQASRHISAGNVSQAGTHLRNARSKARDHVKVLTAMQNHGEIHDFNKDFGELMEIKEKQLADKKTEMGKSENFSSVNEIRKGIFLIDNFAKSHVEYKWLHELHPEDMAQVTGKAGANPKYSGSNFHEYLYPVDAGGRMVHGERKPVTQNEGNAVDREKSLKIATLSKSETVIDRARRVLFQIKTKLTE